LIAKS